MRATIPVAVLIALSSGCGEGLERDVARQLGDPDGARFQNVRNRGGFACGEVNIRNAPGPDQGYRRFVRDARTGETLLDQETSPDPDVSTNDSACRQREAYKSAVDRFRCANAPEARAEQTAQQRFERSWSRHCA